MLEHTFIHLPGFGPRRERRLWERGISSWDDFLGRFGFSPYTKQLCSAVATSKYALGAGDGSYFASALPSQEAWRAFPHFQRAAYLDIETTGLSPATDHVTVIGVFDGKKTHSYVHGINLEDFNEDIRKYDMLVTFNGSMFDVPFLKSHIANLDMPRLHIDLRFVLASLGVRGGLKRIEEQFGMGRQGDLKGLTGYDAVKMWQAYIRRKDEKALDRLIRYNSADIGNLKKLMEWAYKEKRKCTGFDGIRN